MSTLNPLETMQAIRETYLRYLKTIYPFQDQTLREAFARELEKDGQIVKGPLLESVPPFVFGRSLAQLASEGIVHRKFRELCSDALPWDRPLYLHQDQAITHIIQHQRNTIVATGTGSGKTESFLIPILHHLLCEEQAGTLSQPGVRALLLYPMNALANDQLRRLRRVLISYPSITFGRYTGETEEEKRRAEERFYRQFPGEPLLPNELISRQQMRNAPPHILLTNYAMLEYLLLRPEDCELFDGDTGKHWRFLVLDEAHIYDGASGIELAMLLRRLKDRVVGSEQGKLRCIATSATLGKGQEDFPAATTFATNLFGEPFEWQHNDIRRQDSIEATRRPFFSSDEIWGEGTAQLYRALQNAITSLPETVPDAQDVITRLAETASTIVPSGVVGTARTAAQALWNGSVDKNRSIATVETFLYHILLGDGRLHRLQENLAVEPYFLDEIAQQVFPGQHDASNYLVSLVDLAVRARPTPESHSLLPARYHAFARALEGVFVCLNASAHADQRSHLFLQRHEVCPECGGWVIELATCVRCGATYAVGEVPPGRLQNSTQHLPILRQLTNYAHDRPAQPAYFLLGAKEGNIDEDEAVVNGDDIMEEDAHGYPCRLCLHCGTLVPVHQPQCPCGGMTIPLREMLLKQGQEPTGCLHCGARSTNPVIFRFLTGQDAPVSVLATALYQQLPPSQDQEVIDLPGQGRKLLIFADSRQDAAFFAPYLEQTYNKVLHRRLIFNTLLSDQDGLDGHLRLQDIVHRLLRQAEQAGFFHQSQSLDERKRIVTAWLQQELVTLDHRLSLEGVGLLQFRLARPIHWRPPAALRQSPWNLNDEEIWLLIALLLDTLRQQGVTTFPENIDPGDECFAPRNREYFIRKDQAQSKASILSWLPTRGGNRRQNLLERLLARSAPELSPQQRKEAAREALSGLWTHLTEANSPWHDHLVSSIRSVHGIVYRLSHKFWELVPLTGETTETSLYRCTRCRALTTYNLRRLCPTIGCDGSLEVFDKTDCQEETNHYRALYMNMLPIPLSAEEHTAQWTSDEAGQVQEKFIRSQINVLSCSTTFELGVDVGELQTVLMRNVPPTTANYVQRAGRAGRRTDSAAFTLTYAQRRSHDLTYYSNPRAIVAGKITPPRIFLENEKIVRRHMQAVLLAAFFRSAFDQRQRLFKNIGEFFRPEGGLASGTQLAISFAEVRPAVVQAALQRIVPEHMQKEVGVDDWSWLRTEDNDGFLDLLERVEAEVTGDLDDYLRMEIEAAQAKKYMDSQHFQRVMQTIRGRSLLGFMASRNLLPKYGFPTDVVELKTDHLANPIASKVQLERDLRIALSEYAPGAEIVAAKHLWTSGGLYKQPGKDWPVYHYAICPTCNRFISQKEDIAPICACGANLRNEQSKTFLIPEFGFVAARNADRTPGESRPQRLYASRVYFAEYATPQPGQSAYQLHEFHTVDMLMKKHIQISSYYSRFGKLALVNTGITGRGFRVCQQCGFAGVVPESGQTGNRRRQERSAAHTHPRTGKPCNGFTQTHHLGHEFLTDVVEIRFEGLTARSASPALWRSLVYALLEGASLALNIRRDDLDGTHYYYTRGNPPAIILFDNVPGGAGHVRRIDEEIPAVLQAAYQRVKNECCGPETSCYECLRNYRNQPYHHELQRGLVQDFLQHLF